MQKKDVEINFFDQYGKDHDFDVFDQRAYDRIKRELKKYLNTEGKKLKALDVGCGTGSATKQLSDLGLELCGMDISPNSIKYAQEKCPDVQFKVGDAENMPYADNSFDVVFMCALMHHFPDFSKVVSEAHRVLKKGGVFFAYDPHMHNPVMWAYRSKQSPLYSPVGVTENEQPLTKDKIKKVFAASPFSDVKVYAISGITFKRLESETASKFLPLYNAVEIMFDFPLFRNALGSFIITSAKK